MSKPLPSVIDGYVRDGLVLCFDGYQPPAGGVWKDLSGSGNDMVLGADATHNVTDHCLNFGSSNGCKTPKSVPFRGGSTGLTLEAVFRVSAKKGLLFQNTAVKWPSRPSFGLGVFYLPYLGDNNNDILFNGGYNLDNPAACQLLVRGGANVAYSCRCTPTERWYKNTGTTAFNDADATLVWGLDTAGALDLMCIRLYTRKLTNDEILNNRALDIKRFALEGSNTTII